MEINENLAKLFENYHNQQNYKKEKIDVNGDGKINSKDKTALTKEAKSLLKSDNLFDFNNDGKVDYLDLTAAGDGFDIDGDGKISDMEKSFLKKYKSKMKTSIMKSLKDTSNMDVDNFVAFKKGVEQMDDADKKFWKSTIKSVETKLTKAALKADKTLNKKTLAKLVEQKMQEPEAVEKPKEIVDDGKVGIPIGEKPTEIIDDNETGIPIGEEPTKIIDDNETGIPIGEEPKEIIDDNIIQIDPLETPQGYMAELINRIGSYLPDYFNLNVNPSDMTNVEMGVWNTDEQGGQEVGVTHFEQHFSYTSDYVSGRTRVVGYSYDIQGNKDGSLHIVRKEILKADDGEPNREAEILEFDLDASRQPIWQEYHID